MFDEEDCIIQHQVECASKEDCALIRIIGSYTDVFVLLCTMYVVKNWSNADIYMEEFIGEKTFDKHQENGRKAQRFNTFIVGSSCTDWM